MRFLRPFRAVSVGDHDIWIVDSNGAFVTRFPRTSDDLAADVCRAQKVAEADTGEEDE